MSKEATARLRAAFKQHGWNTRDVTVRGDSLGSSVTAIVRSARVNSAALQRILQSAEHVDIRYTPESAEHVDIRYTPEVKRILARRHIEAIEDAVLALEAISDDRAVPIAGTHCSLAWDEPKTLAIWGAERIEYRCHYAKPLDPQQAADPELIAFHQARDLELIAFHVALLEEGAAEVSS